MEKDVSVFITGSNMISLKGVEKVFNSGNHVVHALKDVSFEVGSGEIFGVMGRSQAGKTTLARCLNLLERPQSGTIIFDNCPITSLGGEGLRLIRQKIGFLTKQAHLLNSRNTFDNVALSLEFSNTSKSDIDHLVTSHLNLLGLSDKARTFPNMLTAIQKQKTALARALVQKPKVLICDDITQYLDGKSSHTLLQFLKFLNTEHKISIIYLSHDLELLKNLCHRMLVLHQGEVVEEDSVLNIFINPKSAITQELIKSITRRTLPNILRQQLRATYSENLNPILRLSFLGPSSKEPLIAHVIQQFGLTLNIIQAHLDSIQEETLGVMIIEIYGKEENIKKAIEYLEMKELYIEVLGYVPRAS